MRKATRLRQNGVAREIIAFISESCWSYFSNQREVQCAAVHGRVFPLAGKQPQLVTLLCGWGRRPSSQQADDPGRAIEIVALTGQLYATDSKRPIATACATQKVPRSAGIGGRSLFIPGRYSGPADVGPSAEASYDIAIGCTRKVRHERGCFNGGLWLVSDGGPTGYRKIQIKPLVKRLTFPFAGIRYVALPLKFWSPGTPKGARRPRHAPSAWRGRCLFFVGKWQQSSLRPNGTLPDSSWDIWEAR